VEDGSSRKGGRSGGVVRCRHHAPQIPCVRTAAAGAAVAGAAGSSAAVLATALPAPAQGGTPAERERLSKLLRGGTTAAEWKQLGSVDVDTAMCDLFIWLADRGLCPGCVDTVTGALLEVRRAVAGTCTCSRCMGLCKGAAAGTSLDSVVPYVPGGPPELLRVQGRLRAICGIYRLEALSYNDRPVYKKERTDAYLLYTSLKDWMVSGRPDAGGSRCEGWAYVNDPAETPDEVCGVWKVSGPRGWEEDRSLCVTAFEGLPEELRAGLAYDDGSAIAQRLAADDRGVLVVPLQEEEVLQEVLWAPEEPLPGGLRTGACAHLQTAETVQRELRCWLRWLLRDRLDAQRRRLLASAQVAASLCRLFSCAALQQLEQAAEEPVTGTRGREKKGKTAAKKAARAATAAAALTDVTEVGLCASPPRSPAGTVEAEVMPPGYSGSAEAECCAPDTTVFSPGGSTEAGCGAPDSDESSSTRASSEEPPDARGARLAMDARRLMEQMGWKHEDQVIKEALDGAEVAAWHEQHPSYRQAVREERQKLKTQFQQWARATLA